MSVTAKNEDAAHIERQGNINSFIFISRAEVERITGMSRSWIYQAMVDNEFPRPVPCTLKTRRWVLSEVQSWMRKKCEERDMKIQTNYS